MFTFYLVKGSIGSTQTNLILNILKGDLICLIQLALPIEYFSFKLLTFEE